MKTKISAKQLIGRQTRIVTTSATHNGEVVRETKNTISVQTENGIKVLVKKHLTIFAPEKITGESLSLRPEDRMKGA